MRGGEVLPLRAGAYPPPLETVRPVLRPRKRPEPSPGRPVGPNGYDEPEIPPFVNSPNLSQGC